MYDYVIKDIESILRGSFIEGKSIDLNSLCSTIDYHHKLWPELEEINVALRNIGGYLIERRDTKLIISPSEELSDEVITQNDMDVVRKQAREMLVDLIMELDDKWESKEELNKFLNQLNRDEG